ncbi:MAG: glycosyltransferase [Thermoleophilia bacterium]|jgi:hypothetical protein
MAGDNLTLGIISHQRIARSMAGPGIRCWEVAKALCGDFNVKLFTPEESDLEPDGFELVTYDEKTLLGLAVDCGALFSQGFIFNNYPELARRGRFLIVDLYVPMTLEALAQYGHKRIDEQDAIQGNILLALMEQLTIGDYFVCASERQRDFWLGLLSAAGRVMPETFNEDGSLYKLIGLLPFGLPEEPPRATGKALKGVHPAIGKDDKVLLWGGGIYNWLDPLTPIRAMGRLAQRREEIKLYFLGTRHPDPGVPRMRVYDEALDLSRELGLLDKNVIFNDQWVRYEDRVNYLLESDLGSSANIPHVETRFSFRTRILDCIWSSLPVVSTDGDSLSDLVRDRELGLVVACGDDEAYAGAIERLLDDEDLRGRCLGNLKKLAAGYTWDQAVAGLRERLHEHSSEEKPRGPLVHPLGMGKMHNQLKACELRLRELEGITPLEWKSLSAYKTSLRGSARKVKRKLRRR